MQSYIRLLLIPVLTCNLVSCLNRRGDLPQRRLKAAFPLMDDDRHNPPLPIHNIQPITPPPSLSKPSSRPTWRRKSKKPTTRPTWRRKSKQPSHAPTSKKSSEPSNGPTITNSPSGLHSINPTAHISEQPTIVRSNKPSNKPSLNPTQQKSEQPSLKPTNAPDTDAPSYIPVTTTPSLGKTTEPTQIHSAIPTVRKSHPPSIKPHPEQTVTPTVTRSMKPSRIPSNRRSVAPSSKPSSLTSDQSSAPPSTYPFIDTRTPSNVPLSTKLTHPPTVFPTAPINSSNCSTSFDGNYGNVSSSLPAILIDYKYELVMNVTLQGFHSTADTVNAVEIAITNLLVKVLFSECSTVLRQTRNLRFMSANSVVGISASPNDVLSQESCSSVDPNYIHQSGTQCVVVNGRLTLYISNDGSIWTPITQSLNEIESGMNNGVLADSSDVIVFLRFVNPVANVVATGSGTSSSVGDKSNVNEWPFILGAFVGFGMILLLYAVVKRRRLSKDGERKEYMENPSLMSASDDSSFVSEGVKMIESNDVSSYCVDESTIDPWELPEREKAPQRDKLILSSYNGYCIEGRNLLTVADALTNFICSNYDDGRSSALINASTVTVCDHIPNSDLSYDSDIVVLEKNVSDDVPCNTLSLDENLLSVEETFSETNLSYSTADEEFVDNSTLISTLSIMPHECTNEGIHRLFILHPNMNDTVNAHSTTCIKNVSSHGNNEYDSTLSINSDKQDSIGELDSSVPNSSESCSSVGIEKTETKISPSDLCSECLLSVRSSDTSQQTDTCSISQENLHESPYTQSQACICSNQSTPFICDTFLTDNQNDSSCTLCPSEEDGLCLTPRMDTSVEITETEVTLMQELDSPIANTLVCAICRKNMEGKARKLCQCGKGCYLMAHSSCALEKFPLPSVSHPGTPPIVTFILCRDKGKATSPVRRETPLTYTPVQLDICSNQSTPLISNTCQEDNRSVRSLSLHPSDEVALYLTTKIDTYDDVTETDVNLAQAPDSSTVHSLV